MTPTVTTVLTSIPVAMRSHRIPATLQYPPPPAQHAGPVVNADADLQRLLACLLAPGVPGGDPARHRHGAAETVLWIVGGFDGGAECGHEAIAENLSSVP